MNGSLVEHIRCSSADEFLDALSPRGPYLKSYPRHKKEWMFRGHGNDDCYKLIPKALRYDQRDHLYALSQVQPENSEQMQLNQWQVRAEIAVIERFIRRCDDHGLMVPGHGVHLERTLREANERLKCGSEVLINWPYESMLPALAIAQHHGLPTRLLDWTYSPLKAALFAARDARKKPHESTSAAIDDQPCPSFSVWAMRTSALKRMPPISPSMNQDRVDLVHVPRCDNLYLHAQEGLFTLSRVNAFDLSDFVDRRPLDSQIESYEINPSYGFTAYPVLYHFVVSRQETMGCLAGLESEGVTAATLYPDYKGVVESLFDDAYYPE